MSDDDDLEDSIALVELHYAVIAHCAALRQIAGHIEADRMPAALARLEGAIADLERVLRTHANNKRIRARLDELKRKGK
jgi:hypothetical protein